MKEFENGTDTSATAASNARQQIASGSSGHGVSLGPKFIRKLFLYPHSFALFDWI
jgi:hypothetical protein